MPKGIRNQSVTTDEAPRKLTITLRPADYDALAERAGEQYRTPQLQAAWLVAKVLSEADRGAANGSASSTHAARIIDRAAARNSEPAAA